MYNDINNGVLLCGNLFPYLNEINSIAIDIKINMLAANILGKVRTSP